MSHFPADKAATNRRGMIGSPIAWYGGWLLILSGFAHAIIWALDGGAWTGPVSWRKPILFGISTGLTLLSVAWIASMLRPRVWDRTLYTVLTLSLVVEVGLITVQQWRGVASHFNHATPFDSGIEYSMTLLIVVATVLLTIVSVRAFRYLDAAEDQKIAVRSGLAYLIISCAIGFWVLWNGQVRQAMGLNPSIFGEAGVTKFPHGVAIHASQLFPLLAATLRYFRISLARRIQTIWLAIGLMATFQVFSLVQTLLGRTRFDVNFTGLSTLIVGFVLSLLLVWVVSRQNQQPGKLKTDLQESDVFQA